MDIIINFVKTNNLDEFTTLSQIRNQLREEFGGIEYRKLLKIKDGLYNHKYNVKDYEYDMWNNLVNTRRELLFLIDCEFNPECTPSTEYILERQVSPPIEALFPKDNFKPSGRDYGLLFE